MEADADFFVTNCRIIFTDLEVAQPREAESLLRGCPAWIRTKNNASKGRCVTVTPQGKESAIGVNR